MRPLAIALLIGALPAVAAGQSAPRSLSLELGFARDSAAPLGERAPVALAAAWWLTGELDATARVAWAFAARTSDRAAASSFEAGMGLRYGVARWAALRPQLVADLAFVHVFDPPTSEAWASDSGVRVGAGVGLEIFFARDVSLTFSARMSELALVSGDGGLGGAVALAAAAYF
jgi:hypothetical protein